MLCLQHRALAVLLLLGTGAAAQQTETPTPPETHPYTLHVYANRMQVAALVLDGSRENIPGIPTDKFSLSIDSGPRFHPTRTRTEGDDPIHLAVLIDAASSDDDLVRHVLAELPHFAETSLHPTDFISTYAVDCKLVGSLNGAPASAETVTRGLASLMAFPSLHRPNGHHCSSTVKLWDAVGAVESRMAGNPGRYVLLLVSEGIDDDSTVTAERVTDLAGMHSIAIFDLRSPPTTSGNFALNRVMASDLSAINASNALSRMTASNGGLVFSILPHDVPRTLQHLDRLLRSRYIVEFPAPDGNEGGMHGLDVQVAKAHEVFVTGVSWIAISPDVKDDPSTVPSAASPTVMGHKRPSQPK